MTSLAAASDTVARSGIGSVHGFLPWLILTAGWTAGAFGGGAALAWVYKRLHPHLAFYKLWAFWTMILSGVAAVVLGLRLA
ncbi:MAG: hypothetical protein JWM27_637 [Gemmatimonadetes bacterium]|nr:hypothetical protein [Gemmatimonadota bacterium]